MTKLVILGGGAAGLLTALTLAKCGKQGLEITLIDAKTFSEFTPGLISVLYQTTDDAFIRHFKSVTRDYATLLQPLGITFIHGVIRNVTETKVILADQQQVNFDIAVICTGSFCHAPWRIDASQPVDWHERLNYLKQQRLKYQAAEDIVCVGAGSLGVEVASEIAHRAPDKRVVLVNARDTTVLPGAPGNLGRSAQRILDHRPSVTVISGARAEPDGEGYLIVKGRRIKADLAYACTGIGPNTAFLPNAWLDDHQRVQVDPFLRVVGAPNVFAIGDVNNVNEPKMFLTAHLQAMHFVRNLMRLLSNKHMQPYYGSRPTMIVSLGPSFGVAHIGGVLTLQGFPFGLNKGSRLAALSKYIVEWITTRNGILKLLMNQVLYLFLARTRYI